MNATDASIGSSVSNSQVLESLGRMEDALDLMKEEQAQLSDLVTKKLEEMGHRLESLKEQVDSLKEKVDRPKSAKRPAEKELAPASPKLQARGSGARPDMSFLEEAGFWG